MRGKGADQNVITEEHGIEQMECVEVWEPWQAEWTDIQPNDLACSGGPAQQGQSLQADRRMSTECDTVFCLTCLVTYCQHDFVINVVNFVVHLYPLAPCGKTTRHRYLSSSPYSWLSITYFIMWSRWAMIKVDNPLCWKMTLLSRCLCLSSYLILMECRKHGKCSKHRNRNGSPQYTGGYCK